MLCHPFIIYPNVPAIDSGKAIAEDVPIAFFNSILHQFKYETTNEPPPIETNADIKPIPFPTTNNSFFIS